MILPTQLVHIRISKELLHQVDTAADGLYLSRNRYIRQAVAEKLRKTARHSLLWLHVKPRVGATSCPCRGRQREQLAQR